MSALLQARLAELDLRGLSVEAIVARLNAPDTALPPVTVLRPTRIGPGTVMAALGPADGAALMDSLTALAQQSRPIHWALGVILRGELDLSVANARAQVDQLAAAGVMTPAQAAALKAIAESQRYPSWAEHHGLTVGYREVVIAMGVHTQQIGALVRYTAASGDWQIDVEPVGLGVRIEVRPVGTGGLEYSSGANLDHLADLIVAARADAIQRGITWSA